jgi:polar amino acid transport system substrate-binding protein
MTEMPIDAPPSTNTRAVRLTEIARTFLKIGAMSYGGPAIMGITQSEVEENRGGIAKEEFVQACRVGPQARKERVMRRLLRCGLALVLVMAALPTGDRTAHAADSILTEILRRGTVRIATAVSTRPLRFEDENGNLQGYDIDIANRLAKDLGVTIDWIKTNSVGRVAMLETKQADITIASFTPNLERLKTIGFTDPYSTAVLSLLSRTDRKDLGSVADFNRPEVKFAIPRGTTMAKAVATYTPKATVVEFSGFADMIAALYAGQADAMLIPEAMVNWIEKSSGGKYHNAGALGPPEDDAIGFPQGDFVWWLWLNRFVREINEDGTNYTLRIKWFGDAPMPAFIKPPPKSG